MHARCAGAYLHVIVCMCRVRMHACTLCGRMLACDCVHVRSVGVMRGCVCTCVVGSTCPRVHACLRARARMRRVHVYAGSRVGARARKCKCPHEKMRLYMCVGVRGYGHV